MTTLDGDPIYFTSPAEFRAWLEAHHETGPDVWVGYYKKATGKPSLTWQEAVDEALCFGWIDGIRKAVDGERFKQRFTPRRKNSNWSAVNIKRIGELIEQGLVHPAGLRAFEQRTEARSGVYSYEQRKEVALDPEYERAFRANEAAWAWFDSRPAGYRQTAIYWVMNAKREETRRKRLETLIEDSANGRMLRQFAR